MTARPARFLLFLLLLVYSSISKSSYTIGLHRLWDLHVVLARLLRKLSRGKSSHYGESKKIQMPPSHQRHSFTYSKMVSVGRSHKRHNHEMPVTFSQQPVILLEALRSNFDLVLNILLGLSLYSLVSQRKKFAWEAARLKNLSPQYCSCILLSKFTTPFIPLTNITVQLTQGYLRFNP